MIESILFALDLLVVTYCCWIVVRVGRKPQVMASDLGFFAFKESKEEVNK
ncbi:hypothetical protein [Hydrogenophaga sp.]